jgi:hypothetical protein
VGAGAAGCALFTVVSAAAAPNRPAIFLSMFPLWNFHNQRLRGRGDNSHASTWFLDSARPGDRIFLPDVSVGSIATETRCSSYVRLPLNLRHNLAAPRATRSELSDCST